MLAVEGGEHLGQAQRVRGGGRDAHGAAHDAGVLVHRPARLGRLGEDRLGAGEQVLAGRRELHAAARAPQQRDPELGLEPPDLLRQRGLA